MREISGCSGDPTETSTGEAAGVRVLFTVGRHTAEILGHPTPSRARRVAISWRRYALNNARAITRALEWVKLTLPLGLT
jgi:hypothetical protein